MTKEHIPAIKDLIVDRVLSGGLNTSTQRYKIQYIHPAIKDGKMIFDAKIAIEHRIEKSADDKFKFFSLRFDNPTALFNFIGHLITAYAYFKKKKGEINIVDYEIKKIKDLVEISFNEALTEKNRNI